MLGLALCGCPNPQLYTSPRATPVGRAVGFVAPQLVKRSDGGRNVAPVLGMRFGLAPRLDLGFRANFGSIATDIKWNAIRTQHFDLALDGGVEILPYTLYVDLPVLMGFNVADEVSLLASTGLTLGAGQEPGSFDGSSPYRSPSGDPAHAGRAFLRGGLGVQLRLTPSFAIQPEILALHLISGSPYTSDFISGGLGLCWGRLPY